MLTLSYQNKLIEAGCDEAGRGCLAGPVVAAAVILPQKFKHPLLNDSKQVKEKDRATLRTIIEKEAISFAVAFVDHKIIDSINILQASIKAMHNALDDLKIIPQFIIIDGNKFNPYKNIQHQCIVKGDALYKNIAAASILAKTYRDEYMMTLHKKYPEYNWQQNKGYPSAWHRQKVLELGLTPYHRKTFKLKEDLQLKLL